jgi:hypothetical protein
MMRQALVFAMRGVLASAFRRSKDLGSGDYTGIEAPQTESGIYLALV